MARYVVAAQDEVRVLRLSKRVVAREALAGHEGRPYLLAEVRLRLLARPGPVEPEPAAGLAVVPGLIAIIDVDAAAGPISVSHLHRLVTTRQCHQGHRAEYRSKHASVH